MTDREESDQPRKRIAVACGRCRKRKIRCSGDPGNGGPCSNCKNAGYEPCLFLRVSSTERHFKDSDYTYNLEAARPYAHQSPGAVSPLSSLPQYAHDIATGDGLTPYRQSSYPYSSSSSKGYYPNMSGWASAYPDDGSNVDYSLNYSSYQIINQEAPPLVPGYSQFNTRKSVYVDPEAPPYSYGNLVHRPAVNSDSQGFSLSSMAASLPSASERLHSSVNRTLTSSSSYRTEGIPTQYSNAKASSSNGIPDVAYSNLQPTFESPYSTTGTLAPTIAHRPSSHADTATYPPGPTTASDQLYTSGEQTMRPTEDASGGLGYVYGENKLSGLRRDSHSSGGVSANSLLSNGHVYVPDSHSAHPTPHPYVVSNASSTSHGRGIVDGTTTSGSGAGTGYAGRGGRGSGGGSGGSGSSHRPSDSQRRSAGSLRGG